MSKEFKSYRKESRGNWGMEAGPGDQLSLEQLQTGAILRIADAVELMSKNYLSLQREVEWYKNADTRKVEWYKNADTRKVEIINDLKNKLNSERAAKMRFKNQLNKNK